MIDFPNAKSIFTPKGEIAEIARGAEILFQKQKYKCEVEYLESTGTQHIDTNFVPNTNSKMWLDFYPTVKQSRCFAGSRNSGTSRAFTVNSGDSHKTQYAAFGSSGNINLGAHTVGRHEISIENGLFTYDGVEKVVAGRTFTGTYSVYLFACNTNGATLQSTCRIYASKLWDFEVLVLDLIPVLDWNDRPCMYDKVTDELFYNQGTGEFLYG